MNLDFFGLRDKPFNPTPDPRLLYLPPGHREAFAQLAYGVQERKGFILLTGEVGTGKTTLIQALLQQLDANTAVAVVASSMLPFDGLIEYVLEDFGIAKPGDSPAQRLIALQHFLIERYRAGQNTVLVLDEAQNLSIKTLEQIRLLSNVETPTDKLLQILLVGQPELRAKLARPELRQLEQRITLRCAIRPLGLGDIRQYIRTRLRLAGGRDLNLFTEGAITRIARYAGGIPRIVNTVCDQCLLIGYADQTRRIDHRIVEEAIAYLEADQSSGRRGSRVPTRGAYRFRRWELLTALTILLVAGGGLAVLYLGALAHSLEVSTTWLSSLLHTARGWLAR